MCDDGRLSGTRPPLLLPLFPPLVLFLLLLVLHGSEGGEKKLRQWVIRPTLYDVVTSCEKYYILFFSFPPPGIIFLKKGLRNRRLFRHRPNVHPHCLQIVSAAAAATESCVALVMYCTVPDFSATWVSLRLHICTLCLCVTSEAEGNATEIITAHISAFLWQQPQRVLNHHTAINRVGLFSVVIMLLSRMSKR